MQPLDWTIVILYCLISLGLGIVLTQKASEGVESYFASSRKLGWLLAGTSMVATSFSSDTPLLVTGIVRQRGIWGNWEIWALAASTMFAVFFFSKLWKRANVLTEVEFVELRYSGKPAAFLRGFKAVYWGIFYNIFIMGAWPMTGLVKIMQETTHWSKPQSIFFCMALTTLYCSLSGYWGVVLTDFFQFFVATAGAVILAVYAVQAAGGMETITRVLEHTGKLAFIPPATGAEAGGILTTPFGWFLGLILIQWWAWKNADGGGMIVQRMSSCKDEKQATYATLWFNFAHYALRSWPWILTALASLVLLPDLADHERAYPRLAMSLLPVGMRGLMIASFFAAFMSTMSTHLNWGASYFMNDFYRRFLKPKASEKHYVHISQITPVILALFATGVAFFTDSISQVFTLVLNLTAAVGPVYFLRWFWWRINPWSEISAMLISLPVFWLRPVFFAAIGIPAAPLYELIFMVLCSAAVWIPVTLLSSPCEKKHLDHFFKQVNPPGLWPAIHQKKENWLPHLILWFLGTTALMCSTIGPLKWLLGDIPVGISLCSAALLLWLIVLYGLQKKMGNLSA
ncbi:MAG: Na+:solute symporter [Candidatus Omnitrophica bacterium]|nr:Na+:solute symporter [Candidatus Omnitrophota bacterium]